MKIFQIKFQLIFAKIIRYKKSFLTSVKDQ
jgi:hypothetical protein